MPTTRLTTKRLTNGYFDVYFDGKLTDWRIINGSLGVSGRGRNLYGIVNAKTEFRRWLGPLATCKKVLAHTLAKEAGGR